jgi:hypothetical protein
MLEPDHNYINLGWFAFIPDDGVTIELDLDFGAYFDMFMGAAE